jgi:hypothetical protein
MNIYNGFLKRLIPPHIKYHLRLCVEFLFDTGKKSNFSQFGEDAFLLSYFETKAWKRDSKKSRRLPFSPPRLMPGFYVDIGAFSPKLDSNTYAFYKRGWSGINIDATPNSMRGFRLIRRRDINIEAAISDKVEVLRFYCWGTPSVINTLSSEKAKH